MALSSTKILYFLYPLFVDLHYIISGPSFFFLLFCLPNLSIHLVTANSSYFLNITLFQMPQKMALHKKQYKILSAKLRLQSKKLGRFLVLLKKCPGRKLRRSVYYLCCCYYLFFHGV